MKTIFLATLIIICCGLHASNYYVAPWGNDTWSGMSWDSAFVTLQHAADIVGTGDSVFVANGEYVGFDLRTGGTDALPVVFSAYGDSVEITVENHVTPDGINVENADWVVIDGFNIHDITRAGIRIAVSQHCTVKNNVCEYNGRWGIFTAFADYGVIEHNICSYSSEEHGIYFSNSADHPLIRFNTCHHNSRCGIHMNGDESMGGDGLITDAIVACNIIYENGATGGSGINCDGVAESYIYNNLLYMNHASGVSLYQIDASAGSYDTKVFNNTIINASDARWCLNINTESYGDTVYNNILINLHAWRGSICIDASSAPDFWSDYNIMVNSLSNDGGNSAMTFSQWQALGYDPHSMLSDPLDSIFVDWSIGDYHLRSGSQAIDGGTDAVAVIVQCDLDGTLRPQGSGYDIGAYEFVEVNIGDVAGIHPHLVTVFNTGTYVDFNDLRRGDRVSIYDAIGRLVHESPVLERKHYRWNVQKARSGIYFYLIYSDCQQALRHGKILVIR